MSSRIAQNTRGTLSFLLMIVYTAVIMVPLFLFAFAKLLSPTRGVRDVFRRGRTELIETAHRQIGEQTALDPDILTVGFARRFATYKRADLLLRDIDRISAIISDTDRPVQFVFAGKAHPKDVPGKEMLKKLIAFCQHGIKRSDGASAITGTGALHQLRQAAENRGGIALGGGRLADGQRDLARRARLGALEDLHQVLVGVGRAIEVALLDGRRRALPVRAAWIPAPCAASTFSVLS